MRWINVYPPFLGAGIRATPGADGLTFDVSMPLRFWNRNLFGTHFGGSLYSMCDPFYVLILARALGPDYNVWDKAAAIRFVRPGRGLVRAHFEIPREEIEALRERADRGETIEPTFTVRVEDAAGELIAEVEKRLWIRRR